MRRADRLIDLIQILRSGGVHKAQEIADQLNVSLRSVYRDMDTLAASGVPIVGERGIGYRLTAAITLPPLNLTKIELEALHLGLAIVGDGGDTDLKAAASSLSGKIDAVLPIDRQTAPSGWGFATYPFADVAAGFDHMPTMRRAIQAKQKLKISYADSVGDKCQSVVWPLALDYWGRVWTGAMWCEETSTFLSLRLDKITEMKTIQGLFVDEPGKTLADFQKLNQR